MALLDPLEQLLRPPGAATWRKILTWVGGIALALVLVEVSVGGVWASVGWVIETLGAAGMAGLVCLVLLGALVVINLR